MPEPFTFFVAGALAFNAVVAGVVVIAEQIAKFFEKIREWTLGRHFRALKEYMNAFKKDGYLPPSQQKDLKEVLRNLTDKKWKAILRNHGESEMVAKGEKLLKEAKKVTE